MLELDERQGWILHRGVTPWLHPPRASRADLPQLRIRWVEFSLARLWWCSDQRQPLQRPNSKGWRTETPRSPGMLCSSLGGGRSACCTAMLLQITTICILGSLSPVACPPLRQSLSFGWPVRPGLGSTDKIKEVKEKIWHLPLKARLLKGHHAEQCWGSLLLQALAVPTSRGTVSRTRQVARAAGSVAASMQTCSWGSNRV